MVADRCVVLPGVTLRKGSVLGSGSLAPEDFVAAVGSVWVGSSEGSAVNVAPADPSYNVKVTTTTSFDKCFFCYIFLALLMSHDIANGSCPYLPSTNPRT